MKTTTYSVALALGIAVTTANAAISYTENFDTAGDLVTNYTGWSASGNVGAAGTVASGVLSSSDSDGWTFTTESVMLNVTSTEIAGTGTFDVSTNALTYTAQLTGLGGIVGGHANYVSIGDVAYIWFPLLGGSPSRQVTISNVNVNANEDMVIGSASQNGATGPFDTVTVSIIENGANFDTTFTFDAGSDGVDYTRNVTLTAAQLGTFDSIGVGSWGASSGSVAVDSISVQQVPEPSSAALLGLGGLALILRRRK